MSRIGTQYQSFGILEKAGSSTWTLTNTTAAVTSWTINGGTLDVASLGAAGTGAITFASGIETRAIENASLSNHNFRNTVADFGTGDLIDLTGLDFVQGATGSYDPATHILSVSSNGVTDTVTLASPAGTLFKPISDGRLGTEVELDAVPKITGTRANQQTSPFVPLHPFGQVVIGDGNPGQTETVTIT